MTRRLVGLATGSALPLTAPSAPPSSGGGPGFRSLRSPRSVALGLFLAAIFVDMTARAGVGSGQRAPEFRLPQLSGGTVALSNLRGKVVVIDFWAQWCEPCRRELPELDRLAKQYADKGVAIVAVNIDKERDNAARLVRQLNLTLPVLLDPAGSLAATYDLPRMPSSFVVDKKGIVRFVHAGYESGDVERFKRELDQLLK